MVIYQLHEYGGEYEEFYDHIIGSYLRKERAEEEKTKAEVKAKKREEKSKRCRSCHYLFPEDIAKDRFANLEHLFDSIVDGFFGYCDEAKLVEDDYGINCENYELSWDTPTFEIEEVEVEE